MIKLVVFDYDGVFTDGNIYVIEDFALKKYNCKDGYGISLLKKNNIKTAIISSHTLETNVNEIKRHLKIDYYSQGENNKLKVLNKIMEDHNYNYDDIAYIGDDINDIEIMSKVRFSACPKDAIDDCKSIVNYICKKKGGQGCVREFIDIILNYNSIDQSIFNNFNTIDQIRDEAIFQLYNYEKLNFDFITNKILDCTGNIYVSGVGKSEDISIHLVNLLKSINIKSYYFNILNSIHGDIGCIDENDLILFFSKSGNTKEIIDIIDSIKCYKIGISCNDKSSFTHNCNYNIVLPFYSELYNSKNINCIPTNSYMSQLFFINILVNRLIENSDINLDLYKCNHPGGNIGRNLKKIKDIMITEYPKIILEDEVELNKVLLEMTKYGIGCCFFVNKNNNLFGVLSDGDIRRLLVNKNINYISTNELNNKFVAIKNKNLYLNHLNDNKDYLKYKKAKFIPVIENNCIIGIINYHKI